MPNYIGTPIPGATDPDYVPTSGDVGQYLFCDVTATNTGKWYFEVVQTTGSNNSVGVSEAGAALDACPGFGGGSGATGAVAPNNGNPITSEGSLTFGGGSLPSGGEGDVIGVAIDSDAGKIWWSENNVFDLGGGNDPATGAGPIVTFTGGSLTLFPFVTTYTNTDKAFSLQIGADLTYAPPSGFTSLG